LRTGIPKTVDASNPEKPPMLFFWTLSKMLLSSLPFSFVATEILPFLPAFLTLTFTSGNGSKKIKEVSRIDLQCFEMSHALMCSIIKMEDCSPSNFKERVGVWYAQALIKVMPSN